MNIGNGYQLNRNVNVNGLWVQAVEGNLPPARSGHCIEAEYTAADGSGPLYSVIGYTAMMAAVCIAALHLGRRAAWSRNMRITSSRADEVGERIKLATGRDAILVFSRRLGERRTLGTLLVIVHRLEVPRFTSLVRSIDPEAFIDIVPAAALSGAERVPSQDEPGGQPRVSKYGNTLP